MDGPNLNPCPLPPEATKTLEELGYSTKIVQDLEYLQQPQNILKERQHIGSPSPDQTLIQIEELSKLLDNLSVPIISLEKKVHKAKESCKNYKIK